MGEYPSCFVKKKGTPQPAGGSTLNAAADRPGRGLLRPPPFPLLAPSWVRPPPHVLLSSGRAPSSASPLASSGSGRCTGREGTPHSGTRPTAGVPPTPPDSAARSHGRRWRSLLPIIARRERVWVGIFARKSPPAQGSAAEGLRFISSLCLEIS